MEVHQQLFFSFLLTCRGAQTSTLQCCQPGVFLLKLPPDFKVSGPLANLICDSCGCLISARCQKDGHYCTETSASLWCWCHRDTKKDLVSNLLFVEKLIPTEGPCLKVTLSAELRLAASLVVRMSLVETQSCPSAD